MVDSGATVSVLPYEAGIQLGLIWDDSKAIVRLAGSLGDEIAMPSFLMAEIGNLPIVKLAFAWIRTSVLGQTNFFMEFDVSFYRSRLEFEIRPKSSM